MAARHDQDTVSPGYSRRHWLRACADRPSSGSLTRRSEREQQVPRLAIQKSYVTGGDVHHAVDDCGACGTNRAPFPWTPFTVVTFCVVSYCHNGRPSNVEKVRSVPSRPGAKTTPGTTLTAALSPRCSAIDGCGSM